MAKIQPSFLTKELKYIQIDFNGYFNETTSRCQKHNYDSSVFIKKLFPASGFQTIDLMLVFLGKYVVLMMHAFFVKIFFQHEKMTTVLTHWVSFRWWIKMIHSMWSKSMFYERITIWIFYIHSWDHHFLQFNKWMLRIALE